MKKTDKIIEKLQSKIKEIESQLVKIKPSYETTLSYTLNGDRQNLNVVGKQKLIDILNDVNKEYYFLNKTYNQLNINCDILVQNFSHSQWLSDIKNKLSIIDNKTKQQKIKLFKEQLHNLTSEERKTETMLERIEKEINDIT